MKLKTYKFDYCLPDNWLFSSA